MLGIVLVNYNTSALTLDALRSTTTVPDSTEMRVKVVDNASADDERRQLREGVKGMPAVELLEMQQNLGFAAACNHGIAVLLADSRVDWILLLNNDAVLLQEGMSRLLEATVKHPSSAMIAARMHHRRSPDKVDSLGIAMYASALASNRMDMRDRLVGPTGGLALYSRRLLETLKSEHGSIFDERFFCYAEDTDLALRARLLGFEAAFVDERIALHHGQASSGSGFNDFVLYHGIRNSIWVVVKDFPLPWLLVLSPLIVLLHAGIVLRHGLGGHWLTVWRLYRDAFKGIPSMWRSRRVIQRSKVLPWRGFGRLLTPRFYDDAYLHMAWRELWRRGRDTS